MAKQKTKLTSEELRQIEKGVSREIWKEQGCPFFKGGTHTDKKKERSRRKCREKVRLD